MLISAHNSDTFDVTSLKKKKAQRVQNPTIRFELEIEKPTSETFTQYNYNKLVLKTYRLLNKRKKVEVKREKKLKRLGQLANEQDEGENKKEILLGKDDLNILENELKVERAHIRELLSEYQKKVIISKELENEDGLLNAPQMFDQDDHDDDEEDNEEEDDEENEVNEEELDQNKQSEKESSKKSKKKLIKANNKCDRDMNRYKLADFAYLAQGYDEEDSFIDNSEAQDSKIPAFMTPKHGGFYINKEQLQLTHKKKKKLKSTTEEKRILDEKEENDGKKLKFEMSDEEDEDYYVYLEEEDSDESKEVEDSENSREEKTLPKLEALAPMPESIPRVLQKDAQKANVEVALNSTYEKPKKKAVLIHLDNIDQEQQISKSNINSIDQNKTQLNAEIIKSKKRKINENSAPNHLEKERKKIKNETKVVIGSSFKANFLI
jgi:hypothetical protein